ncbi:MAG: ferrous iron transport protein B [Chloroherpetonaceae bacterium]|nr:ferrous iron transport protein B [Chthonomonadaceae bacterium]MDW8208327.1 ferrous iron transport protein B [Chloroherpetonaceae bacterium]
MIAHSPTSDRSHTPVRALRVAMIGNPNSGKTTLFNALTGLRQKVGNYAGVTVEKKEGRMRLHNGRTAHLYDLPGLYSLTPHAPDEVIAREALMGLRPDTPPPDVILNVVDASCLERSLYLTSQLLDLGTPVVIALTMTDIATSNAIQIDAEALAEATGVPVVSVHARKRRGLAELIHAIERAAQEDARPGQSWQPPQELVREIQPVQIALQRERQLSSRVAFVEAITLLMQDESRDGMPLSGPIRTEVIAARERLEAAGVGFAERMVEARYQWIARVLERAARLTLESPASGMRISASALSNRIDRLVLHPVLGYVLFFGIMAALFQAIFTWAEAPMTLIEEGINGLGAQIAARMPEGDLRALLIEGVLGGVGAAMVFLPQILMLFFFITLLEDTGYMARAAFLMDRLMSKVGLHGKSFLPLVSSFACAIPGIMATRTIGDPKARLITILVAPLMSCSARLPVYALMIAAFVPDRPVLRIAGLTVLTLPGVTLLAMYLLGMCAAFAMAWVFHRTLLRGISPTFLMEMPTYRLPSLKTALMQTVERAWLFVQRAGTIILAISIVLWGLSTYPKRTDLPPGERLAHSFVGQMGRTLEPLIAPLGFDWKIGVGIVASFAAREVFVTTMGTVYNVDDAQSDAGQVTLRQKLQEDTDPRTGRPVFTPLVAICLMVFYVLAMQCMSTLAVVRRETNSWKWPLFQFGYMTILAWAVTFAVRQAGRALGYT